jgi:hypothetical protein
MKTYFIEISFNNENKFVNYNRYLRGIVSAKSKEEAEQKVVDHFKPYYTAGENGIFKVQCNWIVNIPSRDIIEKHWRNATRSMGVIHYDEGNKRTFQLEKTKKEVLENWDYCNCNWNEPTVYYEPRKGGYVASIHNYMAMPSEFMFFKGTTNEVYKKAKKWVRDNTFKGEYYSKY